MAGPHESQRNSVPVNTVNRKHRATPVRDWLAQEQSAKNVVLIPLTEDEHQNALELFATETPEMPEPPRREAPSVDVSNVTFQHAPVLREESRRQLTWQAPLLAAVFTAVVTIGVLMFIHMMHTNSSGELATLRGQPRERASSWRDPAETTSATALLTSRTIAANDLATLLGSAEPRREIPIVKVSGDLDGFEKVPLRAAATSFPPSPVRSDEAPPKQEPSSQSAPAPSARVAEPVEISEPRVAPPLGSLPLPAGIPVEPSPVVARAAADPRGETSGAPLPRVPASETGAIQTVLSQYRTAFRDLDAGAARAIWPSVDAKALNKAFESLERQDLVFNSCEIAVRDVRAVASCNGTARYVPRIGNRDRHDERRTWEFKLRKVDEIWLIDTVSAR
jgi:hypothetical protein